ncbi:hypothetical protein [Tissierella sp.]|mgnify:CR=1 FL=1|uniref:hypothetical protein n=1 Tax=Tissierella sp. TaxID=41274 RepID=UPI003069A78B
MRKLPKPNDNSKEVFLECISNIRKKEFKERLELCADEIAAAVNDYDDKKNNNKLHRIRSTDNIAGIVSNEEMKNLYNNKLVGKKGPGRKYYDKLIASAKNGICPICGHREVSTLDHYLSKMKYPLFAVALINLIPACKDCNFTKGEYEFNNEKGATIHPYYDEIDNVIWLNAKLKEEDDIVFIFEVLKPKGWNDLLYERVKNHFKIFDLNKLYSVQAAVEFEGMKRMLIKIYQRSGEEEVRNHLKECLESYEYVNLNSWKCGMYRALIESEWFYSDWLERYLE